VVDHHRPVCGLVGQPVVQHCIQECLVDMDSTVVGDVAELAEVIHKLADARAGGADHPE